MTLETSQINDLRNSFNSAKIAEIAKYAIIFSNTNNLAGYNKFSIMLHLRSWFDFYFCSIASHQYKV